MNRQILKDKVAVITGASGGLGEGIAKAMAREGAIAALFSCNIERLKEHEKKIKSQGQEAVSFQVDVSDVAQVNRAVEDLLNMIQDASMAEQEWVEYLKTRYGWRYQTE